MKNVLIITGGNKGIGKGIVEAYQTNGFEILSLARTKNNDPSYKQITQIAIDLNEVDKLEKCLIDLIKQLDETTIEKITLINNAGTLGKISTLENIQPQDIAKTVNLNTIAPLVLSSLFLSLTKSWVCKKSIINISSGAAYKTYPGWSVYSATKAAIDMMTKTVAAEQETKTNPAKIIAVYPGVVDTEMQTKIRATEKENFASLDRFLELKASNSLANPSTVGKKIFEVDHSTNIENGALVNVNDI
ncbi:SDR family NAD(P)-dependent oxidoreductase [Pedobacter namyangjuensis]|uniref:SDR family NAD(P)-dependent oxidoreductase n=1 Tax=Pedobacter namyangjuensis TaxID=600626 RepID=UPI000DE3CD77|nr:SDR family NAD(P)-dependent oxidoreductase [Pedobacter namyangjuensis]